MDRQNPMMPGRVAGQLESVWQEKDKAASNTKSTVKGNCEQTGGLKGYLNCGKGGVGREDEEATSSLGS